MSALRVLMLRLRRRTLRAVGTMVMGVLMLWSPRPRAVIYGLNDDEENLLVTAIVLPGMYPGRVTLLCNDPARVEEYLRLVSRSIEHSDAGGVHLIRSTWWTRLWHHSSSELVLTSHVMLSSPRARRGRLHVHLTHGWGPKRYNPPPSSETVVASAVHLWDEAHIGGMGKDPTRSEILSGLMRHAVHRGLDESAVRDALKLCGIDPARPYVIWAPTYRATQSYGLGTSREGDSLTTEESHGALAAQSLAAAAQAANVQLVVKPHVVDVDDLSGLGITSITNEDLWNAGVTPTQFLFSANGLVSDYSSIWVDFLLTGRSIYLLCTDLEVFQSTRGLVGPPMSTYAGNLLHLDAVGAPAFFTAVAAGKTYHEPALRTLRELVQLDGRDPARALQERIDHWRSSTTVQGH